MFTREILDKIKSQTYKQQDNFWSFDCDNNWIRNASNCMKGKIGKLLACYHFSSLKETVSKPSNIQHDIIIGDKKVEVKLSCLNNTGMFKWLQIRLNDDYDKLMLFGVYPSSIRVWILDKVFVNQLSEQKIIKPQQGGVRTESEIMYLGVDAFSLPDWLASSELVDSH